MAEQSAKRTPTPAAEKSAAAAGTTDTGPGAQRSGETSDELTNGRGQFAQTKTSTVPDEVDEENEPTRANPGVHPEATEQMLDRQRRQREANEIQPGEPGSIADERHPDKDRVVNGIVQR